MNNDHTHAWFEVESGIVEEILFSRGLATVFSQRCPTRESTPNEDAACLIEMSDRQGLLAVADGVGGANAGNRASRAVIQGLLGRVKPTQDVRESARGDILDAIEATNQEILEWGTGAGSTLAVVEYVNGSLRSFHVGDAKAMLVSNRGRVKFTTIGHAPIAMAVEIGMLAEEDALHHDDRNLITNCLGSREMKIEIGPLVEMATRDTLLIASDGLFDNLTTDEISMVVRTGDLARKTEQLAEMAHQRMLGSPNEGSSVSLPSKPDDLTIICFRQNR